MVNSREWVNIIDGLNKKPIDITANRKEIHWDSGECLIGIAQYNLWMADFYAVFGDHQRLDEWGGMLRWGDAFQQPIKELGLV